MTFSSYQKRFESALKGYLETMGKKGPLRDACEYAMMSGGKRLRPILTLMTAEAIGSCDVMPVSLSAEFFHTASLIADDLPCMDNDLVRRGMPSLHKAFGEGSAILASYTLIAAGYGGISENAKIMQKDAKFALSANERAVCCLEAVSRLAGIQGATQGQFLDLYGSLSNLDAIYEVIEKKTVTLFEISLLFGWLFGGGDISKLPLLKSCAHHLGMAFQIADDLEDESQDLFRKEGANIARFVGVEKAISLFEEEITSFEKTLKSLSLWTDSFQALFYRLADRQSLFLGSSL